MAEKAPFDAILVAAAPAEIPEQLLAQMAVGGVMLIPVGKEHGIQTLQRVIRTESGYEIESLETRDFHTVFVR